MAWLAHEALSARARHLPKAELSATFTSDPSPPIQHPSLPSGKQRWRSGEILACVASWRSSRRKQAADGGGGGIDLRSTPVSASPEKNGRWRSRRVRTPPLRSRSSHPPPPSVACEKREGHAARGERRNPMAEGVGLTFGPRQFRLRRRRTVANAPAAFERFRYAPEVLTHPLRQWCVKSAKAMPHAESGGIQWRRGWDSNPVSVRFKGIARVRISLGCLVSSTRAFQAFPQNSDSCGTFAELFQLTSTVSRSATQ